MLSIAAEQAVRTGAASLVLALILFLAPHRLDVNIVLSTTLIGGGPSVFVTFSLPVHASRCSSFPPGALRRVPLGVEAC